MRFGKRVQNSRSEPRNGPWTLTRVDTTQWPFGRNSFVLKLYSETLTKLIPDVSDPADAETGPQPQSDTPQPDDARPLVPGHVAV
jgi:hypothetical protein